MTTSQSELTDVGLSEMETQRRGSEKSDLAKVARLPISVVVATKNEALNIGNCLEALTQASQVVVIDSNSTDSTASIAKKYGAEVIQFNYRGGYPKKRQWVLDTYPLSNEWVMLVDADEVVTQDLWREIRGVLDRPSADAFLAKKEFHFMGRRFQFGGFSHRAVLLFRKRTARFEHLFDDSTSGMDMEVHERLIISGAVGSLDSPLVHHDFKGLHAYIARHNNYSSWEAQLRHQLSASRKYGKDSISPRLFGNVQERRRFLKHIVMRVPFESWIWFVYHYLIRLGMLEGRRGLIACQIRANYIREVRAKLFEMEADDTR